MNSRTIREANPGDAPVLWNLIKGLAEYERLSHELGGSEGDLRAHLAENFLVVALCEVGSEAIGYALAYPTFSTFRTRRGMWLEDIFVVPGRRGEGHGRALFQWVIERASELGCCRVEWYVLDWNESAIRFYESAGANVLPDWRIASLTL